MSTAKATLYKEIPVRDADGNDISLSLFQITEGDGAGAVFGVDASFLDQIADRFDDNDDDGDLVVPNPFAKTEHPENVILHYPEEPRSELADLKEALSHALARYDALNAEQKEPWADDGTLARMRDLLAPEKPQEGTRPAHTPGPWHMARRMGVIQITDSPIPADEQIIANVHGGVGWGISEGEKNANAALIKASPDLVKALGDIVQKAYLAPGKHEDCHVHPDLIDTGRRLLAEVEARAIMP